VGPSERKGSENLAKSGATAVDQSNLGPPPRDRPMRGDAPKKRLTPKGWGLKELGQITRRAKRNAAEGADKSSRLTESHLPYVPGSLRVR